MAQLCHPFVVNKTVKKVLLKNDENNLWSGIKCVENKPNKEGKDTALFKFLQRRQ